MMHRIKTRRYATKHTLSQADAVHRFVADTLFERLSYIKCQPTVVLNLEAGHTFTHEMLQAHYPRASIVTKDIFSASLRSYRASSVDCVFSNLCFQELDEIPAFFTEINRVLKPGGLLLFSLLGVDTLKELKTAFSAKDVYTHVHTFPDMHEIGDAMKAAALVDSVMDMNVLTVQYDTLRDVREDLKLLGATNVSEQRRTGLMAPSVWRAVAHDMESYRDAEAALALSVEIIYGHAWGSDTILGEEGEVCIPIDSIERQKRPNSKQA